jgi:hypothetical protein
MLEKAGTAAAAPMQAKRQTRVDFMVNLLWGTGNGLGTG